MSAFQGSLYTLAIALCLFSAGIARNAAPAQSRRLTYFTRYLLVESLGFVFELLMVHPATPFKALWLALYMCSSLAVAPMLWLAVREIVKGEDSKFSHLGQTNLVLLAVGALLTLPLAETAHAGTHYFNAVAPVSALHSKVVHSGMLLCTAVFACQVPVFLRRVRELLKENARVSSVEISRLLHIPLLIVSATWVLGVLRTLNCALLDAPHDFWPIFATADVVITVGCIYALGSRASALARGVRDIPSNPSNQLVKEAGEEMSSPGAAVVAILEKSAEPPLKYAKSALDEQSRARIRRKLKEAMDQHHLYRDPLINLRGLSAAIKENTHYVSQVLNQDFESGFHEFVSAQRIEEASRRLKRSDESILEIATAVGFNSKSTFNTAFKKFTGTTPSEYRRAAA